MNRLICLAIFIFGSNCTLLYAQNIVKFDSLILDISKLTIKKKTGASSGFTIWDNKLWAANDGYGVFFSKDTGKTFYAASKGLGELLVTAITTHKNKLYCGTKFKGLYVFNKLRRRWFRLKKGVVDTIFWSLVSNGKYLFASSEDNGILRSKDGLAWEKTGINLDNKIYMDSVVFTGKNILFSNNKALYVSTPRYVFFTLNNGNSWKKIKTPSHPSFGKIQFISGKNDSILLSFFPGGVYLTTNNGIKWRNIYGDGDLFPWSAELINGKVWVCTIFRYNGGLYEIERGVWNKVLPIGWANHITFYKGYYFVGGKKNIIYRFKYPQ